MTKKPIFAVSVTVALFISFNAFSSDQSAYDRYLMRPDGSFLYITNNVISSDGIYPTQSSLCSYSPSSNTIRQLFSIGNCGINYFSYSSSGKYISYIRSCPTKDLNSDITLFISDNNGRTISTYKNVFQTDWDERADRLYFLSGQEHEGYPGFHPKGFHVFNPVNKSIINMPATYYDLFSASYDGNVYLTDFNTVKKYIPTSGKIIPTSHKGIYFSPDGRYYFKGGYEDTSSLFMAKDDKELAEINKKLGGTYNMYQFCLWISRDVAIVGSQQSKLAVNVVTGRTSTPFNANIQGINISRTKMLINPMVNSRYDFTQLKIIDMPKIK